MKINIHQEISTVQGLLDTYNKTKKVQESSFFVFLVKDRTQYRIILILSEGLNKSELCKPDDFDFLGDFKLTIRNDIKKILEKGYDKAVFFNEGNKFCVEYIIDGKKYKKFFDTLQDLFIYFPYAEYNTCRNGKTPDKDVSYDLKDPVQFEFAHHSILSPKNHY